MTPLSRAQRGRLAFCSRRCYGESKRGQPVFDRAEYEARGLAWTGEANPNWQGGKATRKASHRAWVDRNRESVRHRHALRRALRRSAPGTFTLQQWLDLKAAHNNRCAKCHRPEGEVKLTRDHIVPLSKGGSNDIANIQPLCLSCNSSKKDRMHEGLEQVRTWAASDLGVVIPLPNEIEAD